jgi:ABC-type phosphate transport system substrate-binding protein
MGSNVFKITRGHVLALALGLGLAGSLATAPASFAATKQPTPAGANCQPDGKINGAGSTFQTNVINDAFTYEYQNDVCGETPVSTNLFQGGTYNSTAFPSLGASDPSDFSFSGGTVQGMVAYNYGSATNGSGAGLARLSCRTDMFAGTDLPYNTTQWGELDNTAGDETTATGFASSPYQCQNYLTGANPSGKLNLTVSPPPYGPQAYGTWPNPSGETDAVAKPMSFPIAAGAVADFANLENKSPSATVGGCTTPPLSGQILDLDTAEYDDIWQGTINQWNDPTLVANNSWLSSDGCSGPIQRVVRQDNSGTTAITMFTLNGYDQGTLCANGEATPPSAGNNWYYDAIASANDGLWPRGCTAPNTSTVAPNEVWAGETNTNALTGTSGSGALISLLESTNGGFTGNGGYGGIGYAELGLWASGPQPLTTQGLVEVELATPATQSNATPAYILPGPGATQKSNCSVPATLPVGSSAASAVGLGTTTWTNTGTPGSPGKQDIADAAGGTGYPQCGLTFDLVYTGQSESNEVAATADTGLATPGCTVSVNVTTTADNPASSSTLVVPSTTGFPASGEVSVDSQVLTYTSTTSTSFVLSGTTGADIPSGSVVSLYGFSTSNAATATTPGITGACQTYNDSVSGITNDQLRTVYSYFSYIFSPLGEDVSAEGASNSNVMTAQTLDPLPVAWLPAIEEGFQQNL